MNSKNIMNTSIISLLFSPYFLYSMQNSATPLGPSAQYTAAQLLSESESSPAPAHPSESVDVPITAQLPLRPELPSAQLVLDDDREIHFHHDRTHQNVAHNGNTGEMRLIRTQQRMRARRNSVAVENNFSRDFSQNSDNNREPIRPRRHSSFDYTDEYANAHKPPLPIYPHPQHKQMNGRHHSSLGINSMHYAAPQTHHEQYSSLGAHDMRHATYAAPHARHERDRSLGAAEMHNAARAARAHHGHPHAHAEWNNFDTDTTHNTAPIENPHHERPRAHSGRNKFGVDGKGSAAPPIPNRPHARPGRNSFDISDVGNAAPPIGGRPHARPRQNDFDVADMGNAAPPIGGRPHAHPRQNDFDVAGMGNAAPPIGGRPHARPGRNSFDTSDRGSIASAESAHAENEYEQAHRTENPQSPDNIFQNIDTQANNDQEHIWQPNNMATDTIDDGQINFEKSDYSESSGNEQTNNQHPQPHPLPHHNPQQEYQQEYQQYPRPHKETRDYNTHNYTNYDSDNTTYAADVDWDQVYQFRDYPLIAFLIIVYSQYPKTTVISIALLGALAIWKHDVVMGWWQGAKEKANNVIDFNRKNLNGKIAYFKAAALLKATMLKNEILNNKSKKLMISNVTQAKTL